MDNYIIKKVKIDDNIEFIYSKKKSIAIHFDDIRYILENNKKYIIITKMNFQHSYAFRKGVFCSSWLDDKLSLTILKELKNNNIPIQEVDIHTLEYRLYR